MQSIYDYLNYRSYLENWYNDKKRKNPAFSYQVFANKAGFKSKSFLKMVISGQKNLSGASLEKLRNVLKLTSRQYDYFKDIVAFTQTNNRNLRNHYFEKICSYSKRNPGRLLLLQQYSYLAKWYLPTIREIITRVNFGEDYDKLGKMVRPPLSAHQAHQAVKVLLELELVRKTAKGYTATDTTVTTGDEVQSLAVQNFHVQNFALAAESIDTVPAAQRDLSCIIVCVSSDTFSRYKEEIRAFREKLLHMEAQDKNPDRVYHLTVSLFPSSTTLFEEKS
jgi:uncharacterized protein (TIGR02147 family)